MIRKIIHDGNLLRVRSIDNESKIFNYVYNRLKVIPDQLKEKLLSDDAVDSKFVNLVSIMAYDDLFREFVFEVYSGKRMYNDPITDYDIMSFFERVAQESDVVSSWKYETLFKLRRLYARILFEAGLLKNPTKVRELSTPMVSLELIDLLKRLGYAEYVGATVGSV